MSTGPTPLYLFLALNEPNKLLSFHSFLALNKLNKCKQTLDTAFINSHPHANDYAVEEVNLNFIGCGYFITVKLNRFWQLDLLNLKPVYIIEALLLAVTLF